MTPQPSHVQFNGVLTEKPEVIVTPGHLDREETGDPDFDGIHVVFK